MYYNVLDRMYLEQYLINLEELQLLYYYITNHLDGDIINSVIDSETPELFTDYLEKIYNQRKALKTLALVSFSGKIILDDYR